jgi:PAS domain S-box-containing protein
MSHRRKLQRLARRYAATLRRYFGAGERSPREMRHKQREAAGRGISSRGEALLEEAYELGRAANAAGFGVLDMARVHLEAREKLVRADPGGKHRARISRLVGAFFLQTLSPFEATHRGFRETNAALLQRNRELAAEIREHRQAKKALRESEQRFGTLIETAHDVIYSLLPDGRIDLLNRAFEVITGWPRDAWRGKPFAGLLHPDDVPEAVAYFQSVLRGGPPERREYRVRKANGEYAVGEFTKVREMRDGRCVGVFGIGRDTTERRQSEEALRQSEEHYRQLYHEAQIMQEKLRDLSNQVLQVQEEERKRISRELHDQVGQSLTAISVTLAALQNNGAAKAGHFLRTVAGAQRLLAGTMDTVHRFARELRPAMLDELGLLPALRSHVKIFSERTGLRVRLLADPVAEQLDGDRKTAVFRVAQESLTNVAKHARASRVNISLRRDRQGICLEIADNGRSFRADPETAARQKQRLGLLGMQERVRLVNGQFSIEPLAGRGTTVRVTIPFQATAARA